MAKPEDAEQLSVVELLGGEAFLDVPGLEWIADDTVMSADEHAPLIAAGTVWIAKDTSGEEDEIIGFLSAERVGEDLHIWNISVLPDRQKQGIGRALFAEIEDAAAHLGATKLTLTTFRDLAFNEVFYASLGFVRLEDSDVPNRLREELQEEAKNGLPAERRCAMVKKLGAI